MASAWWYNLRDTLFLIFLLFFGGLQTQFPIYRLAHLKVQPVQEQQTEQVAQLLIDMPVVLTECWLTTPPPSVPHCVYIIYALACSISAQSPGSLCVSRKWLLLCRDPHTHSMFPQLLVGWLLTDKGGGGGKEIGPLKPNETKSPGFGFDFTLDNLTLKPAKLDGILRHPPRLPIKF